MKTIAQLLLVTLLLSFGCSSENTIIRNVTDYASYVDPFIGTGEHGHTYPGATMPFGMVQLSPDTREQNWDGSSGYHNSDPTIMGFTHTHLSGTGESEFCDILFMPTVGKIQLVPGDETNSKTGYRSAFSHDNEKASAGYYSVILDDYNVKAELTATTRTGFHQYTFPASDSSNIIIDLKHRDKVVESHIHIVNDSTITGLRRSTGWAANQYVYFYTTFSKPFENYGIAINDTLVDTITKAEGKNIKAFVRYKTAQDEKILVKTGISAVSVEGAKKNLETENNGWDFQEIVEQGKNQWNKQLSKIEIDGGTKKQLKIFYTSLYHANLHPNIYTDVDGRYRGSDYKVHKSDNYSTYTLFSLWDVFRAQMPLLTITEPSKMNDIINTFLDMHVKAGRLPRWEIAGTLSNHMIGFHSTSVILDAYNKGIRDYDIPLAYEAMKQEMAMEPGRQNKNYSFFNNFGFIPADIDGEGGDISKVMETCYNEWCVSEMAKNLDRQEDYLLYQKRAQFYKNVFDSTTGFMRPRNSNYEWLTPFDPAEPSGHYVEGNAFQYSAFVPHDINGLIDLLGGDETFVKWLDQLFTTHSRFDENAVDASGLIGQYAHGNEPSHNIAYLYNYAGAAPKTQKYVRQILNELYDDTPEGLSGNEDCGQMSAWYVLSAMGFYSANPGEPNYTIASPLFEKVTIHLENGKKFIVRAHNVSAKNIYIQSATLNGKPYTKSWFPHTEIINGSELVFEMGDKPNYNWGKVKSDRPFSQEFVPAVQKPYYRLQENYFMDKATVTLHCPTAGAKIYYTTDGSEPTEKSSLYTDPVLLTKTTELKLGAFKEGLLGSGTVTGLIKKQKKLDFVSFTNYNGDNFKPGLKYEYFENAVLSVNELNNFEPKEKGIISHFSIDERKVNSNYGYIYKGFIKIPQDGVYTFYNESNDGSILYLDGKEFINMDGPHGAYPVSKTVALRAGMYRIEQKFFQMGGGFKNLVSWKGVGINKQEIPADVLFHKE